MPCVPWCRATTTAAMAHMRTRLRAVSPQCVLVCADRIDAKELATAMRALGHDPSEKDISNMLKEVDADGSGCIEFGEFVKLMKKKQPVRNHARMHVSAAHAN